MYSGKHCQGLLSKIFLILGDQDSSIKMIFKLVNFKYYRVICTLKGRVQIVPHMESNAIKCPHVRISQL